MTRTACVPVPLPPQTRLRDDWAKEALSWAGESADGRASARSLSVLRSLRLPLSQARAASLVAAARNCLAPPPHGAPPPAAAAAFAAEALATLASMADATPPGKLLLHPSLFWLSAAALASPFVAVAARGLRLLSSFLLRVPTASGMAADVCLLASEPQGGGPLSGPPSFGPPRSSLGGPRSSSGAAFGGAIPLVARALTSPQTAAEAALLLAELAALPRGADALLTADPAERLPLALAGALPWLLEADRKSVV